MALAKKTVAELDAELDKLNEERLRLKERIAQVMAIRNKKIREDNYDYWGLNEKQYRAAKARAVASGVPAHICLADARKEANKQARDTQTAMAEAARLGVKGLGT